MLRIIKLGWKSLGFLMFFLGLLWLPKDALDYEQAAQPWREMAAMIDQNTGLWIFSGLLLATLLWSDGRRILQDHRKRIAGKTLAAFIENRTRFTIREAACVAVGIHPSEYEGHLEAQGEASEMLYYAREGLIRPAVMTSRQWEAMKRGQEIDGYLRADITLDSFITKDELETYMRPGWKTWLPVLDQQRRERH
ncbi:hypothetical protein H0274_06580 [Altererythrobacter sp. CC-YST694]|uniref:hypothetical protein n=1 Tax=Altererythrobacter sp. CC-YST694 TaxID=2755038 RepID=UPI001D008939|nr:hypothetical protein [Altererythrobacter sp. CC-YST694]MCB5424914.1 hypothetical protein [Altererythrobacter sp. CC-YST694]